MEHSFESLISKYRSFIMGCAIIAIMMFHQPFIFGNPLTEFFHLYGYLGVELFLFVSGFGIAHSIKKNSTHIYYKNRIKRLLPACSFVGIFQFLLSKRFGLTIIGDSAILGVFCLNLWYIYAIIVYYAIAPALYKCIERRGFMIIAIICVFSYLCELIPFDGCHYYLISKIGWILQRLPIFSFGLYVSIKHLNYKTTTILTVGSVFLAISLLLILGSHLVRFKWNVPYVYLLLIPATPALCLILSQIGHQLERIMLTNIIQWVGGLSLELYLWHEFIYTNVKQIPAIIDKSSMIGLIICITLSLILALFTQHSVRSIIAAIEGATHESSHNR